MQRMWGGMLPRKFCLSIGLLLQGDHKTTVNENAAWIKVEPFMSFASHFHLFCLDTRLCTHA